MARRDPSSEKENMVPRVHRSEMASSGLSSVRTRGLAASEHRSHAVLKESSLQNQCPAAVNLCKTNLASSDKDWLKNSSADYFSGKQPAKSLELLREKIGQLRNGGALKQSSPKTASTLDHHSVGESHSRGHTPSIFESSVHVYRDEKVLNSGGTLKEKMKPESHTRKDEVYSRNISPPFLEYEKNSIEQNYDDRESPVSFSTPSISFTGKGQLFQNKADRGGQITSEKQSSFEHDMKSIVNQNQRGENLTAGETARNTSPQEEVARGSRENSVERLPIPSTIDKIIKRAKCSRSGPALRVRRDDPRAYPRTQGPKDDHSPSSEKSSDDEQKSAEKLHLLKTNDNHGNDPPVAPAALEAFNSSNQRMKQDTLMPADEDYARKRKAEADPSITDSSLLLSGVGSVRPVSIEDNEGVHKGGSLTQRERERHQQIINKEIRTDLTSLEQSGERWAEDVAGHPLTGSCTKGTPRYEREPWAWKTSRDTRSLVLPSPTVLDCTKSAKLTGGIPPRYVPPNFESRERKAEANDSPSSEGLKHHCDVLKQMNEAEKREPNNGFSFHSNLNVKPAITDNSDANHLSSTFSSVSIEDRSPRSNLVTKSSMEARTVTQISGHHMNFVATECRSSSGVTGATGLTGLTSQSVGIPYKTATTSSHGVEAQQRPHSQQTAKEGDCGIEMADGNGSLKPTARSAVAVSEYPVHGGHEGNPAKASDPPKERGEKNHKDPSTTQPPPRKSRTEIENDHFVYVNGIRYQKLGQIGKGGSSEVFKVIASNCSIYALKRINLKGRDWSTAQEFYQEIKYLKALRGKRHIIQLVDSEVTNQKVLEKRWEGQEISEEAFIYMVLEYGEIDLAGMLVAKRKEMQSSHETKIDENWLRFYWQQILEAVRTIHDERIVHSDLKPANFMLVRGELKLIDFGIAKAIQNDTTNIVRDSLGGTLNYMAPEACLQNQTDEEGLEIKQGRASDIWSLGCILYQMVYGHTPFAELGFYSKIQAITNPHHKIHYPDVPNPWLLDIMKRCLTWDRRKRLRIPELLEHPFLQPHLAPYCPRCEQIYQMLARTHSSSERSKIVESLLTSFGSWGHSCATGNSGHLGHESPT